MSTFHVACKYTQLALCSCDLGETANAEASHSESWGGATTWRCDPKFLATVTRQAMYGAAAPPRQDDSWPRRTAEEEAAMYLQARVMMSGEEARYGFVKESGAKGGPGGDAAEEDGSGERQSGSEDEEDAEDADDDSDEEGKR